MLKKYPHKKILEISSKSKNIHGNALSAFNLVFRTNKYKDMISVETAFQSSKVFHNGGPYSDLLGKTSLEAKKDLRIRNSGNLLYFSFFGEKWSLTPQTAFYDWLYINALSQHSDLVEHIIQYDCFTDIEFNPEKSINCQAQSAALFVAFYKADMLKDALFSKDQYLSILAAFTKIRSDIAAPQRILVQGSLI